MVTRPWVVRSDSLTSLSIDTSKVQLTITFKGFLPHLRATITGWSEYRYEIYKIVQKLVAFPPIQWLSTAARSQSVHQTDTGQFLLYVMKYTSQRVPIRFLGYLYVYKYCLGLLMNDVVACSRSVLYTQEAICLEYQSRIGTCVWSWKALSFGSEDVAQAFRQCVDQP
jgi:hypothetical protein